MIVPLVRAAADTSGGKAGPLGALLRAGLPVPDGFVVPLEAYRRAVVLRGRAPGPSGRSDGVRDRLESRALSAELLAALGPAVDGLGDVPLAVRSSADDEDTGQTSAAGRYESVLAVRGVTEVVKALRACWVSLHSSRPIGNRGPGAGSGHGDPAMAVIVQRLVDAEIAGVMFTPASEDDDTTIEASWGLGPSVVGGTVTPDSYRVATDGSIVRTIADKRTRIDRAGDRLRTSAVPTPDRSRPTLDNATTARLVQLGRQVAAVLGGPRDVEWAIAGGRIWALQARPITARPPGSTGAALGTSAALAGTPGSSGNATGPARIVRGPRDFALVRPGDILVCPFTDPAWTPLLRIAAGVVTQTGGILSHAAIVARELRIPAVLGVPDVTEKLRDGVTIAIDGDFGTVTTVGW